MDVKNLDAIIFDFDGVLTDNFVYMDQNGTEMVRCSRADGLAFDTLRNLKVPCLILSTEKNKVVQRRAKKLQIPVLQGVGSKAMALKKIVRNNEWSLKKILFVGNDLNDYEVMKLCGYTACPLDSHTKIKTISRFKLRCKGGEGVARELVESVLGINILAYNQQGLNKRS